MKAAKIKRLTSIILCLLFCLSVSLSVSAAGIDMSVLDDTKTFTVTTDSISGITTVEPAKSSDFKVYSTYSRGLLFYPSLVRLSNGELYYRIGGIYGADEWAFFDTFIVRINNKIYTFTDVDSDREVGNNGNIYETMVNIMSAESIGFFEVMKQHRYEPIKVRVRGSRSSVDFELSQKVKDAFIELYDLYCAAGGLNQNLTVDGNIMLVNEMEQTIEEKEYVYISVYDYTYYKDNNPDLVAIYGDDRAAYLNHFIGSGMSEGRQGNNLFNLATYKANNPDLVAAYGDDNVKYYEHFMEQGRAEGRIAA